MIWNQINMHILFTGTAFVHILFNIIKQIDFMCSLEPHMDFNVVQMRFFISNPRNSS